jgi:hypothetical protein
MMAASNQPPQAPSFLHNMGTAFGFIPRQGNLTPSALYQIQQVQANQNQERRLSAAEERTAELHPLNKARLGLENAAAQDNLLFNEEDQQHKRSVWPLQYDEATLDVRAKKQGLESQPEKDRADIELKKAQASELLDRGDYYASGGAASGANRLPRGDILAGKISESEKKYSYLHQLWADRLAVETGSADAKAAKARLDGNVDKLSTQGSAALWQQLSAEMDNMRTLKAMASGGQGGEPTGQPGPTQGAGAQAPQSSWSGFLRSKNIDPYDEDFVNGIPPEQWKALKQEWRASGG